MNEFPKTLKDCHDFIVNFCKQCNEITKNLKSYISGNTFFHGSCAAKRALIQEPAGSSAAAAAWDFQAEFC